MNTEQPRGKRLYPNNAARQAAYRARKKESNPALILATQAMKEAGYDLRLWKMCHQWANGSTLWATDEKDEWAVIVPAATNRPKKVRYDRSPP